MKRITYKQNKFILRLKTNSVNKKAQLNSSMKLSVRCDNFLQFCSMLSVLFYLVHIQCSNTLVCQI